MGKGEPNQEEYTAHRKLATQVEALYIEIEKLAKKRPSERLTPLISKKINHVIQKVRSQVKDDEFLDAIETIPVEDKQVRFDEALILLGELKSVMARQWHGAEYTAYRESRHLTYERQTMR